MGIEKGLFFKKIRGTRVFPVSLKIVIIFILFILVSNFTTNYINIMLGREYQLRLTKQLLAKDLKDIYGFANTQYEIYQFSRDKKGSLDNIKVRALFDLKNDKAVLACFDKDGQFLTVSSPTEKTSYSISKDTLAKMNENLLQGKTEDFVTTKIGEEDYFGVYKFNEKWEMYIYRAEEFKEFYAESTRIFIRISIIKYYSICICIQICIIYREISYLTKYRII